MCTKVQLDNISRQIVQSYHSVYGSDIVAIYLYGSYAREDYDNESDIDITAIVKGDRMDLQNKLKQVWDISADIGLENDIIVSPTVIHYGESKHGLHSTVIKRGLEVAKAKGVRLGRPQTTIETLPYNFLKYYPMFQNGSVNLSELSRLSSISRPTLYKYLKIVEGQ